MHLHTVVALILAAVSTTLINLAYLREHSAAADLPPLTLRDPAGSVRLLLGSRAWLAGFAMETTGFALYVAALALASLALVQSVAAGGIGVLAYVGARVSGARLGRRQLSGVTLSVLGLLALAVSLVNGGGQDHAGSTSGIVAWIAVTAAVAVAVLVAGRRSSSPAVAYAVAGGLLFSMGDFSTKVATEGGVRFVFVATMLLGYGLGTSLIQMGYQRAGPLTVAGLATLMTNALPILAGTVVLHEPVPSGALGVLRVLAFVLVIAGAVLIAAPRAGGSAAPEPPTRPGRSRRAAGSELLSS